MVIPRSHSESVLDHYQDGLFIGGGSPQRDGIDLSGAVPLELKAGDISIHHTRTLHGSATNSSGTSRRLLIYEYAATDAWSISSVNWDTLQTNILRGEATLNVRLEAMTIRMRHPASDPRAGRGIFELQDLLKEKVFAK